MGVCELRGAIYPRGIPVPMSAGSIGGKMIGSARCAVIPSFDATMTRTVANDRRREDGQGYVDQFAGDLDKKKLLALYQELVS